MGVAVADYGEAVSPDKQKSGVVASTVALICVLVYLPALFCGFVNYDDPDYVLNNPLIRSLDWNMLVAAITQSHVGWWMPLTWISLAIDYHFWGQNPFGYHLTNILLHAVNAALVALLADVILKQSRTRSGVQEGEAGYRYFFVLLLAGLLWGLHPLRVESVAWVTERKDVLNGLFTLGSVLLYIHYTVKKERGESAKREYFFSFLLFSLSLTAKSVSVVLPALLLLIDWYPCRRIEKGKITSVLFEKLPFFALSALMTGLTFYSTAQSSYLVSYKYFPFSERLVVSGNAILEYCRFLLWPTGIIPLHIIPDPIPHSFTVKTVIAAGLFVAVLLLHKRRWLTTTWFCFIIPTLPVLAFFQNGDQAFAAHFTYLPAVAPSIAAAFFVTEAYNKTKTAGRYIQYIIASMLAGYLLFYAGVTVQRIGDWKDAETFWSRSIALEPSAILFKERGKLYFAQGDHDAAVNDFSEAITLATGNLKAKIFNLYAFRGEVLRVAGRNEEAIADFTIAIDLFPHPAYYRLRGLALQAVGMGREAEEDFQRAGFDPGFLLWFD